MAKNRRPYVVRIAKVATGTLFAAMSMTGVMMTPIASAAASTPAPHVSPQARINAVQAEMAAAVARGEVSREQADKFVAQLEKQISQS